MEESNELLVNESELHEHYTFSVEKGQQPLRIDKYLMNFVENATRNKIQAAAKDGSILVNGISVKSNYKVKPLDQIRVLFEHPPYENLLVPEDIPIDIVYEDNDLLVVNKAPGMVVHPGHGNYAGTLINALLFHFDNLPNNSSNRPGLVHRIDKNTTGLIVLAKTPEAASHLAKQFFNHTVDRKYMALVWGNVADAEGTIEAHIARHKQNRKMFDAYPEGEIGKHAITHYKLLESYNYVSLVSCILETGRTHQIRVHMKHIGHTLFNDWEYGGDKILKGTIYTKYKQFVDNCFEICPRCALHAATLGFIHPTTNEKVVFESDLPSDMQGVIEKWKNYKAAAHQ